MHYAPVHYFQHRAERWCERPVQYRFLREDLVDAARCRVAAALPLLHVLRAGMTASDEGGWDGDRDGNGDGNGDDDGNSNGGAVKAKAKRTIDRDARAARWARARNALTVLASNPEMYALDDATREEVLAALAAADEWLLCAAVVEVGARAAAGTGSGVGAAGAGTEAGAEGGGRGQAGAAARAAAACVAADPRSLRAGALLAAMPGEGEKNVHRLGYFTAVGDESNGHAASNTAVGVDGGAPFCAVVHERGRPRWGPVRLTRGEAAGDRREMRRAAKDGTLDAVLRRWRSRVLEPTSLPSRKA
jgi:hypothetical protein